MMKQKYSRYCIITILLAVTIILNLPCSELAQAQSAEDEKINMKKATLDECIQTALDNNRLRPASQYAVEMAEAQHRQALAGYWPQVTLRGGYQKMDEYYNFLFPASDIQIPMGGSLPVTIPGVGTVPINSFSVPAQDVKLMDDETYKAEADVQWLLYDGGMRKGYRQQTENLVRIMNQESRRTDLEIIDSIKRYYYGAVLANRLHQLGKDTLSRMESTLNLTETMYKEGSGRVKKTDYLDNKVMVETIRAMVAQLEKNELMARAALANTMGMSWDAEIEPSDTELPHVPLNEALESLVTSAYQFNPDWDKVKAGLLAAEGALMTEKSGYFPKLALTGRLFKYWNDYEAGLVTSQNEDGWDINVGIEIPIFNGFMTKTKVAEARARVNKIKEEQILLKEGIGIQIKDTFLGLNATQKAYKATLDAMTSAAESRDLNTRAYQNDLVDTEDVITAQLMEALMAAQHYKTCYDHIALLSQLNLIVGREVLDKIE
jgi:outer membrane protein